MVQRKNSVIYATEKTERRGSEKSLFFSYRSVKMEEIESLREKLEERRILKLDK